MAKDRDQVEAEIEDRRAGVPLAEQVALLKSKGIEVFTSDSEDDDGVRFEMTFRAPNQAHLARFGKNRDSSNIIRAGVRLCEDVVLDPPKDVLEAEFTRRPGLVLSCVNEILEAVGGGQVFSRRRI